MIKRRTFIQSLSLATAGLMLPINLLKGQKDKFGEVLPKRKLGKTGQVVTMLGVGGYHVGHTDIKDAQELIETAIEQGIRFFDTAHAYQSGESENRYGKFLVPKYRDQIFLMTKSGAKDYKTAREELELSLKRLKTDSVDLWQLHSLSSPEDVDARVKNGVLKLAEEALKEGKAKYIGFTSHANPYAHIKMMEYAGKSGLFSATQLPVNLVDARSEHSYINAFMPKAIEENIGVLAMKTLADGRFFEKKYRKEKVIWNTETPLIPELISVEEALQFAWSLPVSVLITGAENATHIKEKVEYAKRMVQLNEEERTVLIDKLSKHSELQKVEYYKKV